MGQKSCSSHQLNYITRLPNSTVLGSQEKGYTVQQTAAQRSLNQANTCITITSEPQLQLDPEQIPKSILGQVSAFVCKPAIGMQGRGHAYCGQLGWS